MLQKTVKTVQNRVSILVSNTVGDGALEYCSATSFGRERLLVKQTLTGSMRVVVSQPR